MQTIIPLGSNGALRLTTARYYTSSGRSIQAKGIDPDVIVEQDLPPELQGKEPPQPFGEASPQRASFRLPDDPQVGLQGLPTLREFRLGLVT